MLCTCAYLEHVPGCPALGTPEPEREALREALGDLVGFYALACDAANGLLVPPLAYGLLRDALYPGSTADPLTAYNAARAAGVAYNDHAGIAAYCDNRP